MRKRRYSKSGPLTFGQAKMMLNDLGNNIYEAARNLAKRGYTIWEAAALLGIKTSRSYYDQKFEADVLLTPSGTPILTDSVPGLRGTTSGVGGLDFTATLV